MTTWAPPARTPNKYGVAPGDIFYESWGYDQTNVNFYQVIRVTASKAEILPIGSRVVDGRVVAEPSYIMPYDVLINVNRSDERKSKLCSIRKGYQGAPRIVLESGRYWADPWDGRSLYETSAAGLPGH